MVEGCYSFIKGSQEHSQPAVRGGMMQKQPASLTMEMLLRSVTEWNEARKARPGAPVDFNKKDFMELDLSEADLTGVSFKAANLSGANLRDAVLRQAKLNGADLAGADLRRTDFTDADLSGANLVRADLSGAILDGANLGMTDMNHANLSGASLTNARMNGANLTECNLHEATLSWADLSGASLGMADLAEAHMHEARFVDADLLGADLHEADLSEADLHEADLREADLHDVDLHEADLHEADLSEAEMTKADLHQADLRAAKLRWTNLRGANLSGANLSMANLSGADLMESNLSGAEFLGANLCDANLHGANLTMANLRGAELNMANLEAAQTFHTNFTNVDLSKVKGLDTIQHHGPSEISINTIFKSRGRLSDVFLHGCGVAESMIGFIRSLDDSQFDTFSCIVKYSSLDQAFAQRLHDDLEAQGGRCWISPDDRKMERFLEKRIDQVIRCQEKVVLVISESSMKSDWLRSLVQKVAQRELREGRRLLFPVALVKQQRLDEWKLIDHDTGKDLGCELKRYTIPVFFGWEHDSKLYAGEFKHLLESLKGNAGCASQRNS
ncbi:MAG: pentapeptide repeat-containing protein [Chlorobiaceae bacterium]|nr:pentapeptide repeat-containing protein [Chlorobiaceae bacterium]